jgi:type I restriction enzyme, R subunit
MPILPMQAAGYSLAETEAITYEVKYYTQLREEIKTASGDYIDLKAYEPAMRHLIDTYIRAEKSEKVSAFDDLTLIQLIVESGKDAAVTLPTGIRSAQKAVVETIENNLRKILTEETPTNPKYFEKMSARLDALIKKRKAEAQSYENYLAKLIALAKQITKPMTSFDYPSALDSYAKHALYDNFNQNEELALVLDSEIRSTKKDDWRGNKEREVKYALKKTPSSR